MARSLLYINAQVFCALDIENAPIPSTPNFIDKIHIVEGMGQAVPILELYLYDQIGSLAEQLSLFEGKKVDIILGKSEQANFSSTYRVYAFSSLHTHAGQILRVVCTLDSYIYYSRATTKAYTGHSNGVISEVASDCGMLFDGPRVPPNDAQKWLCVGSTLNSFSEDVASHGYTNQSSCMARTVSARGVIRYKDLFNELMQEPTATFLHNDHVSDNPQGLEFLVREVNVASRGGTFSNWMNYGFHQHEHSLSGKEYQNVALNAPIAKGFPVNHEIRQQVQRSRLGYVGLDTGTTEFKSGNVHKNYNTAHYQNVRFLSLFTDKLDCVVEQYTGLQPFDTVNLKFNDLKENSFIQNARYSGLYVISNKTTLLKNGVRYAEKFTLMRPSVGNAN